MRKPREFFVVTRWLMSLCIVCVSILTLSGCNDPRRIEWSKSGDQALIVAGDGLRACDREGRLSDVLAKDVIRALWMGETGKIAVVERIQSRNWSEVRRSERIKTLKTVTDSAMLILSKARRFKGDFKGFEKDLGDIPYAPAAALYLKEKHDDEMLQLMGEQWKKAQNDIFVSIYRVVVYSLSSGRSAGATHYASAVPLSAVPGLSLASRQVIFETIREVNDVHPDPLGRTVILTVKPEPFGDDCGYTLYLVGLSGESHRIDREVAQYPDWSDDGNSILYIRRDQSQEIDSESEKGKEKRLTLATLRRLTVRDGTGKYVETEKPTVLARLVFNNQCKVRATVCGVVFSARRCQLPATDEQTDEGPGLFVLDSRRSSMVLPLLPQSAERSLGDLFSTHFEISPDGKYLASADSKGGISICELATGQIQHPEGSEFSSCDRLIFVPRWRNKDELCLQARGKTDVEVVLYSLSKKEMHGISSTWPTSARKEFID